MNLAAPQGVVEDLFGSLPGPLPTGLLKPSKVLVTNLGDKESEMAGEMRIFGSVSLLHPQDI